MKQLLLLLLAPMMWAQVNNPVPAAITSSGTTVTIPNTYGGYQASFEELIAGSPSTVSITVKGCMRGGTCDSAVDTNTTVASSTIRFVSFPKAYTTFKVTASWTGGTAVSIQVWPSVTTARLLTSGQVIASFSGTPNGSQCLGDSGSLVACSGGGGGGGGTVTSFSAGALSPLFTSSVATATTTPSLTFALTSAGAGTVFGNPAGVSAVPAYTVAPVLGVAGAAAGSIGFHNATSGTITLQPVAGALGTVAITLPAAAGTVAVSATSPITLSAAGAIGLGTLAAGSNGLATSATTDATNATNISSGTLGAARLPISVPTSITNDTNVTGSITSNVLALGWTGTLDKSRLGTLASGSNGLAASATTDTTNAANISAGLLGVARGGSNADLSATGGTSQVLKQVTTGGAVTVGQLAAADLSNGTSGTGNVLLATSPSLTTPSLGVATATSINKLTLTAPATGSTLTIADGKTLTANNSLTFSGTDGISFIFPSVAGTLVTTAGSQQLTSKILGTFTTQGLGTHIQQTTANSDFAGTITLSSGSGTKTFTTSYTSAPIAVCTDATAAAVVKCSATTTVLTATGTGTDIINYIVIGNPN